MPKTRPKSPPEVLNCSIAGDTMVTCGSFRIGSAKFTGMGAPLMPFMKLEFDGLSTRSAPMPLLRARESLSMPMKMATIDRIMITSMATASTLMMERSGRCSKLAKMSLFMSVQISGRRVARKNPSSSG